MKYAAARQFTGRQDGPNLRPPAASSIDDATADRIALAIHEAEPEALFNETALRLNKTAADAVLRKFLELMEPTCADSPSSPQP